MSEPQGICNVNIFNTRLPCCVRQGLQGYPLVQYVMGAALLGALLSLFLLLHALKN